MPPLPKQLQSSLLESFAFYDADRDGRVTFAELGFVLRSVGYLFTNAELHALALSLTPKLFGFLTPSDLLELAASFPETQRFNPLSPERTVAYLAGQLSQGVLAQPNQAQLLCSTGEGLSASEYAAFSMLQSQSVTYGFVPLYR